MPPLPHRPYRRLPVALANILGGLLAQSGWPLPALSEEKRLAAASAQSGLSDWGDEAFRQPLRLLIAALEQEAHLNFLGRLSARRMLTAILVNRLQIQEALRRHRESAAERLDRPIFILGLPRTGTTLLHLLLAQDPAHRVLRFWEGEAPAFQPSQRHVAADPRPRQARRQLRIMHYLAPHFAAIHP